MTQSWRVQAHDGATLDVAWSPDGAVIASGGEDGGVKLWDAATGSLLHTCTFHRGDVTAVAWVAHDVDGGSSSAGKPTSSPSFVLLSGGVDGHVCLWSPSGSLLQSYNPGRVTDIVTDASLRKVRGDQRSFNGGDWTILGKRESHRSLPYWRANR